MSEDSFEDDEIRFGELDVQPDVEASAVDRASNGNHLQLRSVNALEHASPSTYSLDAASRQKIRRPAATLFRSGCQAAEETTTVYLTMDLNSALFR